MFKIGERTWYRGGWGKETPQLVIITGIGEKNGKTVYDTDNGRWGYESQFDPYDSMTEYHQQFNDVLKSLMAKFIK